MAKQPVVVSYGGGTNSTAMLIGMIQRQEPIDLILFADTGGERPETYAYVDMFSKWLAEHGAPSITTVKKTNKNREILTLEENCLSIHSLPSIAYGYKKCSLKFKKEPQEKYVNHWIPARSCWKSGNRVIKLIGYDAGEPHRITNAAIYDELDKKYEHRYPLNEWGWDRTKCTEVIRDAGLQTPGKSSCFFCPSMKKREIVELERNHPELFARAIEIEDNAAENLLTVQGLGRDFAWKNFIWDYKNQISFCDMDEEGNMPCGCYDG